MKLYDRKVDPMLKKNGLFLSVFMSTVVVAVLICVSPVFSGGGLVGGLDIFDKGDDGPGGTSGQEDAEVGDSPEMLRDRLPGMNMELLDDGTVNVTESDGEGGTRRTRLDRAGSTVTETDQDGNEIETEYDDEGNVIREAIIRPDGSTSEWTRNTDGSSTETVRDADDNVISTATRDENDELVSGERVNSDGTRETARRNDDGSLTMERRDEDDNLLRTRTRHADGDGYTNTDHTTGTTTETRRNRDEEGNLTSLTTTTTNQDGSSTERTSTPEGIETVEKDADDRVTRRTNHNRETGSTTETEYDADGNRVRDLVTRKDGTSRERRMRSDGSMEGVIRDDKGNVTEKYLKKEDGTVVRNKKTDWWDKSTIIYPDGSRKEIVEQKFGNKTRIVIDKDADGKVTGHSQSSSRLLDPGQDYYEKSGGRNWYDLSDEEKAKYEVDAEKAQGRGPFSPPEPSDYAKGVLERAKMRAEMEEDIDKLVTEETQQPDAPAEATPEAPKPHVEEPPVKEEPPTKESREAETSRRRAELVKKKNEYAARAKELQTQLDDALDDGDRARIRKIEDQMDTNMEESIPVDEELLQLDALKNDVKEEARYRIATAIRKDAAAQAADMNIEDGKLEDHTQAVAGKFSWISAGAEITTKTSTEARAADARRNLGQANLEAIERIENMPGLLEHRLGDLGQDADAVEAAKKFLADRKEFANNQVEMGTSERNTITAIRAAGTAADVLDTLVGGKIASGGGKLVTRGLKAVKGAKGAKAAPRLVKSGTETLDTLIDTGTRGAKTETLDTLVDVGTRGAKTETIDTLVDVAERGGRGTWSESGARGAEALFDSNLSRGEFLEALIDHSHRVNPTESTIIMRGLEPAAVQAGNIARRAAPTRATIRRLWETGRRSLSSDEIMLKTDLILDGLVTATGELTPRGIRVLGL